MFFSKARRFIAAPVLVQQGKAVEAEALLTDTLAMQQRVRGPDHSETRQTAQILQVTIARRNLEDLGIFEVQVES